MNLLGYGHDAAVGWTMVVLGCGTWTPPLVVVTLGRDYLFNYMARRFDRDANRAQKDGAFIAALVDNTLRGKFSHPLLLQ